MSPNRGIDSLSDGNVRLLNNNADKTDEINKNFCPTARKRVNGDDMVDDMSIPISSQKNSIPSTEIRYFTVSRTGYFALKLYEKKKKKQQQPTTEQEFSALFVSILLYLLVHGGGRALNVAFCSDYVERCNCGTTVS